MVTTGSNSSSSNVTYTYNGLDPFFINWKRINSVFDDMFRTTTDKFPAYNIRKIDENRAVIELAVAGYSKDNLDITEHDNTITIVGELPDTKDEYLYKGIASRKFKRSFVLSDFMEVTGADLVDGILYIGVVRNIPEERKPKSIQINKEITPRKDRKTLSQRIDNLENNKNKNYHESYGK